MRNSVGLALATVTALAAALLGPTQSMAAPATGTATQSQAGQVTLFANPNFTGMVQRVTYADCGVTRVTRVMPVVGSYENRPPDGCQVRLRLRGGGDHVLCAGRAVVPFQYREGPLLVIQSGVTPPCAQ